MSGLVGQGLDRLGGVDVGPDPHRAGGVVGPAVGRPAVPARHGEAPLAHDPGERLPQAGRGLAGEQPRPRRGGQRLPGGRRDVPDVGDPPSGHLAAALPGALLLGAARGAGRCRPGPLRGVGVRPARLRGRRPGVVPRPASAHHRGEDLQPALALVDLLGQPLVQRGELVGGCLLAALRSGQDWRRWLDVARRFHGYSFNNTLLIAAQRPDATAVAGYEAWKALGRQVTKGERGLQILAPVVRRPRAGDDAGAAAAEPGGMDADPAERAGVAPSGAASGTKEQGDRRGGGQVTGWRVAYVWDVSATSGEPLPTPPRPRLLAGQAPPGLWEALTRVVS